MPYNATMNTLFQKAQKFIRKLNALDVFVALIVIGAIIFLISLTINQNRWITIEFKLIQNPTYFVFDNPSTPPFWAVDNLHPGDVQYNNLGQKNLQILSVTNWGYYYLQTWVKASVNVKYNPIGKKYSFQYQPLEIGKPIDVSINGTSVHGIVTAIQGFSDTRPTYTITVKARLVDTSSPYSTFTQGVDPWIADATEKGQIMTDESGKTVAEILNKDASPAKRVVTTSDGRVLVGEDPLKLDVYLTVKLKVTRTNNTYLFLEDNPVIIGALIPLYAKRALLRPVVTQILD